MKIKNLRLATLLVAMVMGAQSTSAQNVGSYEALQNAINNYSTGTTITQPLATVTNDISVPSANQIIEYDKNSKYTINSTCK